MRADKPYHIDVEAKANYLPTQSLPQHDRYVFSYTITLRNSGTVGARLKSRHWIITNANGDIEEVHGEGVVGKKPHLRPGESFTYTSGAVLATPVAAMHGYYDMVADDGEQFRAPIAPFTLAIPGCLH